MFEYTILLLSFSFGLCFQEISVMYVYTALFSRSTQMLTLNSNLSCVNIVTIGIQGTILTDLFFSVALIYFIVDNSTFSL